MKKLPVVRWLARVIGFVAAAFFLALVTGEFLEEFSWDGLVFAGIPALVIAAGYVLSWFREQSGGWVMVGGYVLFSVSPTFYDVYRAADVGFYWAMPLTLLPFLVAGVLFLVSSRLEHRAAAA